MRTYLSGHAGTGKTERLSRRLVTLIESGTRPDRILCLVPQQSAARRLRAALAGARGNTRGEPTLTTIYGLAQQHVALFFPLIAAPAGFAEPGREPIFINVEAAQYFLNQALTPHMPALDDLKLYRPRIVSQILDNLNKAATSGFGLDEIARRLTSAWTGESRRLLAYKAAQDVALDYRAFCLKNGLLDFSLTMDVYTRHLLHTKSYRDYATARYRHVLADNIEEGAPPLHDLLGMLLETCDSALLIEDDPGSYRIFLGADRISAQQLRERCDVRERSSDERLSSDGPAAFGLALGVAIRGEKPQDMRAGGNAVHSLPAGKYWASMVQGVVDRINDLVGEGVKPAEIAVIAPYVEDVLRFELSERLKGSNIAVTALRPSRPLFDHPVVRAMMTLAKLAHPVWALRPASAELARALSTAIADLDIVRAQLLADHAARVSTQGRLPMIEDQAIWTRVGLRFRDRYITLQQWLSNWSDTLASGQPNRPLDLFWQQLFTDVLSVGGFGLNGDLDGATAAERLIRSARAFREVFEQRGLSPETVKRPELLAFAPASSAVASAVASDDIGLAYVSMLDDGMLASQYVRATDVEDGVVLAPVYAYLTNDVRTKVQFWLDVQSSGWHERIYQPLTHPYVLARNWPRDGRWTDEDEHREARHMLQRIVAGLAFRCGERIYLASSQLSISGSEESGLLARAVQRVFGKR